MKPTLWIGLLLCGLQPVVASDSADYPIKVLTPILGERLHTQQQTGFWGDMLRQIMEGVDQSHEFYALPFRRSLTDFAANEFDCLWTMDLELLRGLGLDTVHLIESNVVFYSSRHVFLAPGLPPITSIGDLTGRRVGIGSGSSFEDPLTQVSARVILLSDQSSKLRMLENGRVDAIIGWLPDVLIMDDDSTIIPDIVTNALELSGTNIVLTCHNNPTNQGFIEAVNVAIHEYKVSTDFVNLFHAYGAERMLPKIFNSDE